MAQDLALIDPKQAAETLRRLAQRLETGKLRVHVLKHDILYRGEEWLKIEWSPK